MVTVIKSKDEVLVTLTQRELEAFSMIKEYKMFNMPPRDLMKELRRKKFTNTEKINGIRAFELWKKGAIVQLEHAKAGSSHFPSDNYSKKVFDIGKANHSIGY